jgi:hypothetical protein
MIDQAWRRGPSLRSGAIVLVLLVVTGYAALGIRSGTSVDTDSRRLEATFRGILEGHYVPSRTSGFPAYEFVGAVVWSAGGRTGVMLLSLLLTLAALVLLVRPTGARRTWLGLGSWLCVAVSPTILTNSSAVMETSLLLLALALLSWLLSLDWMATRRGLGMAFALGLLLTTTRPDAVLVCVATIGALAASGLPARARARISGALAAGGLVGLLTVVLVTARFPFRSDILLVESTARRLTRGLVGISTVFSPLGALALLALGALLILLLRSWLPERRHRVAATGPAPLDDMDFVVVWLLLMIVLYGIRFLVLSDDVEYLLPFMVVLAVAAPNLATRSRPTALVAWTALLGMASTTVVTVALTERVDPWDLNPVLRPSIQAGAAVQDLAARHASAVREQAEYQAFMTGSLGGLSAPVSDGTYALLPQDSWYQVRTPKYAAIFATTQGVVGCDELTTRTELPGWRVSQPSGSFADVSSFEAGSALHCGIVALIGSGSITVTARGHAR